MGKFDLTNESTQLVKSHNPFFRKMVDRYEDGVKLFIAVVVYVIFSVIVHYLKVSSAEISFFKFINQLPIELGVAVKYFMYLGTYQGAIAVMLLVLILKKRHLFYLLLTGSALTWLISDVVKLVVDRVRPIGLIEDIITREVHVASYGFPSGHTAMITVLAVILWPYVRRRYRVLLFIAPLMMAFARIYVGVHLPLDVFGGLFLGLIIGYFARLLLGVPEQQLPSRATILQELTKRGFKPVQFESLTTDAYGSVPFIVTLDNGEKLFCKVATSKNFSKDWIDKAFRLIFYRGEERQLPFISNQQRVEHEAYFQQTAHKIGVRVPEMLFTCILDNRSVMSVARFVEGVGLDHIGRNDLPDEITLDLWRQVKLLHRNEIAHRDLRLSNVVIDRAGKVWLIDFGTAESTVNRNFLQKDIVDLLVGLATKLGVKKTVALARAELGEQVLYDAYPFIQPAEVDFSIRWEARQRPSDIFGELREEIESFRPGSPQPLAPIQRITWGRIFIGIVIFVAIYYLFLQFTDIKEAVLRIGRASWPLLILAIGLRLIRFFTDALGFVAVAKRKLSVWLNYLVQFAGTFINRITISGLGSVYMERAYLLKSGFTQPEAFSTILLNYASGFIAQVPLALIFIIFGLGNLHLHLTAPRYLIYFPIVLGAALLGFALLFIFARNLFWQIAGPLRILWRETRLTLVAMREIGWRRLATAAFYNGLSLLNDITVLYLVIISFHGQITYAHAGLIILVSGLLSAPSPTPGKIGAFEAVLIVTLRAFNFDLTDSIAIALVYRLLTFWFPIIPGSISYTILRRRSAV